MTSASLTWPKLGIGVGLRPPHYAHVLERKPKVDWFEVVSENFMSTEGRPIHILEKIREHYPIAIHGVSLSIGSVDPLDRAYLGKLKALVDRVQPVVVSDHLCWTGTDGTNLHDLLPLPQTFETLEHAVERVKQVQDFLGRQILLENASTYIQFKEQELDEWDFVAEVAERANCGLLLDINNIYVNAFNHGFDAEAYLNRVPKKRIGYFHMAGHSNKETYLFDTHEGPIIPKVWKLYEKAIRHYGALSTLIEWDTNIPEWVELEAEVERARKIVHEIA
jgi:hypothetical protein